MDLLDGMKIKFRLSHLRLVLYNGYNLGLCIKFKTNIIQEEVHFLEIYLLSYAKTAREKHCL